MSGGRRGRAYTGGSGKRGGDAWAGEAAGRPGTGPAVTAPWRGRERGRVRGVRGRVGEAYAAARVTWESSRAGWAGAKNAPGRGPWG